MKCKWLVVAAAAATLFTASAEASVIGTDFNGAVATFPPSGAVIGFSGSADGLPGNDLKGSGPGGDVLVFGQRVELDWLDGETFQLTLDFAPGNAGFASNTEWAIGPLTWVDGNGQPVAGSLTGLTLIAQSTADGSTPAAVTLLAPVQDAALFDLAAIGANAPVTTYTFRLETTHSPPQPDPGPTAVPALTPLGLAALLGGLAGVAYASGRGRDRARRRTP